jgi:hypothetical protein
MIHKKGDEVNDLISYESSVFTKLKILALPFWIPTPVLGEVKKPDYRVQYSRGALSKMYNLYTTIIFLIC